MIATTHNVIHCPKIKWKQLEWLVMRAHAHNRNPCTLVYTYLSLFKWIKIAYSYDFWCLYVCLLVLHRWCFCVAYVYGSNSGALNGLPTHTVCEPLDSFIQVSRGVSSDCYNAMVNMKRKTFWQRSTFQFRLLPNWKFGLHFLREILMIHIFRTVGQ